MKILNLFAGIGGNRKYWGNRHKITAVEFNPEIAKIYKDFFPKDKIIIGDAHEYLLNNYKKYDFIWSSPPCQSHSSFRYNIGVRYRGVKPAFPDMRLYEEIVFLQYHASKKTKWIIENVKPYYPPLLEAQKLERHLFWSNFNIPDNKFPKDNIRKAQIPDLQKKYGFDLSKYKISNKRQILRNCVEPEIGRYILSLLNKYI